MRRTERTDRQDRAKEKDKNEEEEDRDTLPSKDFSGDSTHHKAKTFFAETKNQQRKKFFRSNEK
jgi:hypothetical protein